MTNTKPVLTKSHLRAIEESMYAVMTSLTNRMAAAYDLTYGGDRKLSDMLGRVSTPSIDAAKIQERFLRDGLANRIVLAYPKDTWKRPPAVHDGNSRSKFSKAWQKLETKHSVWRKFHQLDVQAGLGDYALLVIGVRDSALTDSVAAPLSSPVNIESITGPDDLLYLQVYSQEEVASITFDERHDSPRYLLPETYTITPKNEFNGSFPTRPGFTVHHSRVLHVADNSYKNDILGYSRLLPAWNTLEDLEKTLGGTAEMTFRAIKEKIIVRMRENYSFADDDDRQDFEERLEAMAHRLANYLTLEGTESVDVERGTVSDPKGLFEALISVLAGIVDIPKRILLGSEAGNLASSQDEGNWAGSIRTRQTTYAEPVIVRPFVGRMIEWGVLPTPKKDTYFVGVLDPYTNDYKWPNIYELSDDAEADVSQKRSSALLQAHNALLQGARITENEVRSMGGLPPVEGGDVFSVAPPNNGENPSEVNDSSVESTDEGDSEEDVA